MFNLGFTEILFIAVLALILIGPKQLPEVARTVGRFLNEIKRSTDAISDEFKSAAFKSEDLYKPFDRKENPGLQSHHDTLPEEHAKGPHHVNQTDDDIQQLELTAVSDEKDGKKDS